MRVRYIGPAGRDLGDDLRFAQATSVNRPPTQTLAESRPAASQSRSRNGLRVQVGAFSTRLNAERAAERVTGAGPVTINTLDRDGSTLFLVSLGPANDARSADRLRDRAAEAGFPDARIIGF